MIFSTHILMGFENMPNHILDLKNQPWWKMGMIRFQTHRYLGHSTNPPLTSALAEETNLKSAFLAD